ncbi:MAG: hypothetical protein ACYDGO_02125 [Smithellaceae bacterium]
MEIIMGSQFNIRITADSFPDHADGSNNNYSLDESTENSLQIDSDDIIKHQVE